MLFERSKNSFSENSEKPFKAEFISCGMRVHLNTNTHVQNPRERIFPKEIPHSSKHYIKSINSVVQTFRMKIQQTLDYIIIFIAIILQAPVEWFDSFKKVQAEKSASYTRRWSAFEIYSRSPEPEIPAVFSAVSLRTGYGRAIIFIVVRLFRFPVAVVEILLLRRVRMYYTCAYNMYLNAASEEFSQVRPRSNFPRPRTETLGIFCAKFNAEFECAQRVPEFDETFFGVLKFLMSNFSTESI